MIDCFLLWTFLNNRKMIKLVNEFLNTNYTLGKEKIRYGVKNILANILTIIYLCKYLLFIYVWNFACIDLYHNSAPIMPEAAISFNMANTDPCQFLKCLPFWTYEKNYFIFLAHMKPLSHLFMYFVLICMHTATSF